MRKEFKIEVSENRIFGLDLLRALAIIIVVLAHTGHFLPTKIRSVYDKIIFSGSVGVSIFFVLSGYLIGKIIIREFTQKEEEKINFNTLLYFWIRRWLRTLPNYYIILIILTLFELYNNSNFTFRSIYRYYFFIQNFIHEIPRTFFVESWSITIEEWFYFLIPLSIFFLIKWTNFNLKKIIVLISFLTILISFLIRLEKYYLIDPTINFHNLVIVRLDNIMIGLIGAYISYYHSSIWKRHTKLHFIIGLIFLIIHQYILNNLLLNPLYTNVLSYTMIAFSVLLLIPFVEEIKPRKNLIYKTITRISIISYSIYLLNLSLIQHYIIFQINWKEIMSNNTIISIVNCLLYWALILTLSTITYNLIEVPFMKLRDSDKIKRFFPSKK